MPGNITSRAQAALFGYIASGKKGAKKAKGLSKEEAKESLRGVKVSKLPAKKKK